MPIDFFSDRELGDRPPTHSDITPTIWRAMRAVIEARIDDGSFGKSFPKACSDPGAIVGTDRSRFLDAAKGMIPGISEVLDHHWFDDDEKLPTLAILDLLEFCHRHIALPVELGYHPYFKHRHLSFDQDAGRSDFRDAMNTILRRNGLVFRIEDTGQVERIAPVELVETLRRASFGTGDSELDILLEQARRGYLSPRDDERRHGLEKLWDGFERLKTLENPDKKTGTKLILDRAAPASPQLRAQLEAEARALTDIGNTLMIRHYEAGKEAINTLDHIDYLFARLFALVRLVLKMSNRGG